jgi:DNA-binding CsgD family transcriptional regulator
LAIAVYLLMLALLVYLLSYYHRKKLERQKRLYEEKQEQLRVIHQLEIEKNEKEIIRLQNEKLANEVTFKNRELADSAMHLVERSDALEKVKDTLQKLYKNDVTNTDLKRAIHLMNDIERSNTDWDRFSASFDEINNDFLKNLKTKYPVLTHNDLKLCAYLQLNLSSKEISQLLNISLRGVEISRYRLRKKIGVSTDVSISDFLNELGDGKLNKE